MATVDPPSSLDRAAVVVAHPDDEVLWFSSVVEDVGAVVFCFEHCDDLPELTAGRRRVVERYPLTTLQSLRLDEPCSVHQVDWFRPEFGPHGLQLNAPSTTQGHRQRYAASYDALLERLRTALEGVDTVFTHNPWGEYGHPDHVQVATVLERLRPELGYRLLYSGYVAPRTMPLAAACLPSLGQWFSLPTRRAFAQRVQQLYEDTECWTWPSEHQHFAHETFLEAAGTPEPGLGYPLNIVTP